MRVRTLYLNFILDIFSKTNWISVSNRHSTVQNNMNCQQMTFMQKIRKKEKKKPERVRLYIYDHTDTIDIGMAFGGECMWKLLWTWNWMQTTNELQILIKFCLHCQSKILSNPNVLKRRGFIFYAYGKYTCRFHRQFCCYIYMLIVNIYYNCFAHSLHQKYSNQLAIECAFYLPFENTCRFANR